MQTNSLPTSSPTIPKSIFDPSSVPIYYATHQVQSALGRLLSIDLDMNILELPDLPGDFQKYPYIPRTDDFMRLLSILHGELEKDLRTTIRVVSNPPDRYHSYEWKSTELFMRRPSKDVEKQFDLSLNLLEFIEQMPEYANTPKLSPEATIAWIEKHYGDRPETSYWQKLKTELGASL